MCVSKNSCKRAIYGDFFHSATAVISSVIHSCTEHGSPIPELLRQILSDISGSSFSFLGAVVLNNSDYDPLAETQLGMGIPI